MRKFMIISISAVIIIVAVILFFIINLDVIVKKGVEKGGPAILKANVELASVDLSILSGSCQLKGLTLGNPEGFKTDYAFHVDNFNVDLDVFSVLSDTIHIKDILIESPGIIFEGGFKNNNLKQLQANAEAFTSSDSRKKPDEKSLSSSPGKKFAIDHLKLTDVSITFNMDMLSSETKTISIPIIELRDIGGGKGINAPEVIKSVLEALNKAVIPNLTKDMFNSEKLKKTVETLEKEVEKYQEDINKEVDGTKNKINQLKGILGM